MCAAARNLRFLPFALEFSGLLHIIFNAVQRAVENIYEWPMEERWIKANAKLMGVPDNKERLIERCFLGAPSEDRALLRKYLGHHVTWRWAQLEDVASQQALL
jgi:hypothetical protein